MADKDFREYLYDELIAIEGIETFTSDFSISMLDIIQNKWALERGIGIIGEALYKAKNIVPDLSITDLNAIIATRHFVVHDYDMVDSARLLIIVKSLYQF